MSKTKPVYLGPSFSPAQIAEALQKAGLVWTSYNDDEDGFTEQLSKLLQQG